MKEKLSVSLFLTIIIGLALANFLNPVRVFSNRENRYLQAMPKVDYQDIVEGKFAKDFESFSTDQFVGRDAWISIKSLADLALLKRDNGRIYFGREHYLFDKDELDQEQMDKNIGHVNRLIGNLQDMKNMDILALLVPSKYEVLDEYLPRAAYLPDQKSMVDDLNEKLDSKIKIIDFIQPLTRKKDQPIYYKTDHHWTSLGAFYAYQAFMDSQQLVAYKQEDFIIDKVSDNFLGSSYRQSGLYFGQADQIYSYTRAKEEDYRIVANGNLVLDGLYDSSYLDKADQYSYFLGGDWALLEIETDVDNEQSLVIIKDSFANSIVPFFLNHYQRIVLIDPRYFNSSITNFIKEENPDQLLFFYNLYNFSQERIFSSF